VAIRNHKTGQFAIVLSTVPQKVLERDMTRVVIELQNQEVSATIYTRWGGNGIARSYLRSDPSMSRLLDQRAPTEELWAYSDIDGAILTVAITSDGG
jgi:hypothetical protein